jgi:molecular chaperone DnaJ
MLTDRSATPAEVKAQWRKLSAELHPDRFATMAAKVQDAATARFAELSAAYAVLGDAKRRRAYDQELDLLTDPCAGCKGGGRTWKQKGVTARTHSICGACHGTGRQQRKAKK